MASLLDLLGETWPARMAKSAYGAVTLPGDVYAGKVDPLSDEGIGRAADLGGMVMGGTYAAAPAGAMGAGAVKPIRAYHGSPHDFDRFDLSKIGTGEGAQAYGHGLYFAENPEVARSYKAAGQPSYVGADRITAAQDLLKEAGGDRAAALNLAQARMSGTTKYGEGKLWTDVINNFDNLVGKTPGRMYEVNINADPAHFLDWDKPLAGQTIAEQAKAAVPSGMRGPFNAMLGGNMTGERFYRQFLPEQRQGENMLVLNPSPTAATERLREAGIPGIKYLDQGSRPLSFDPQRVADLTAAANKYRALGNTAKAAEYEKILAGYPKPTSNYVLFRDDIIDIVKKYGLAGAAAMYGISQDEAKAAMDNPKDKKMSIGRQTYGDEE